MKKRASFTPHSTNYPPVYKIKLIKLSELEKLYTEVILQDAPLSAVQDRMINYVTSLIEPRDWRAIWRSSETGTNSPGIVCDFVVQVLDVARSSLEAYVTIHDILYPSLEGSDVNDSERQKIDKLMTQKAVYVPLTELYVINEPKTTEEYSVTAVVIEHVRFFYRHIWRPWDDVVPRQAELSFAEEVLPDRLRLYFDIRSGSAPQSVADRVNYLLEDATHIRARYDEVNRKMEHANQRMERGDLGSNEDIFANEDILVNEIDLYESLRLRMKLEDYDVEMKRLEDPIIRRIVMKTGIPDEPDETEKVLIVSTEITIPIMEKVISYLRETNPESNSSNEFMEQKADSVPLRFYQNLPNALKEARSGDKLLILPGKYSCDTILWVTKNIIIKGLSTAKDDIIIESSDPTGDIFLHCSADEILISNITIRTLDASQGLVQAHFGKAFFKECTLDGGQCRTSSSGQLILQECTIPHPYTLSDGSENSIIVKSSSLRNSSECSHHKS